MDGPGTGCRRRLRAAGRARLCAPPHWRRDGKRIEVVNEGYHYHVLGEIIVHESTGNNSGRVNKSRP